MDWITTSIEMVGLAILLLWIVIPIREFREIFRIVSRKHAAAQRTTAAHPDDPTGKAGPPPP